MIHKVRLHFWYSFICKFTKESSSENIYQIGQELTELWSWVCGPVLLAHPVYTTSSVQRSASMLWSEDEVGRCVAASVVFWNAIFYRRQSVVYHQWHLVRIAGRIAVNAIMALYSPMIAVCNDYKIPNALDPLVCNPICFGCMAYIAMAIGVQADIKFH